MATLLAAPLCATAQQAGSAEPAAAAPVGVPAAPAASLSASAAAPSQAQWLWWVEEGAKVELRGAVSRDAAGGGRGAMLYPAPDAITFLVAIATHAVINGAARTAEEQRLLDEAAMRSKYYRAIAEAMTLRDLQAMALKGRPALSVASLPPASGMAGSHRIDIVPVFVMAVDGRSLALEAKVSLTRAGGGPLDKAVRVVSAPPGETFSETYWLAEDGRRLKETMAVLVAELIEVAVNEPATDVEPRQKTVRYLEGQDERVERGYLLAERCGRAVVRSLRGVLMSLPLASSNTAASAAECPQPAQEAGSPPTPSPAPATAPVATAAG